MGAEAKIVGHILSYCKRRPKTKAVKIHGSVYQERGAPDLDIVSDGLPYKIEVKVPGEVPSKIQEKRLKEWYDAGAIVGVVTSLAEFKRLLDDFELIVDWRDRIDGI